MKETDVLILDKEGGRGGGIGGWASYTCLHISKCSQTFHRSQPE
jgi:hypothetical protein